VLDDVMVTRERCGIARFLLCPAMRLTVREEYMQRLCALLRAGAAARMREDAAFFDGALLPSFQVTSCDVTVATVITSLASLRVRSFARLLYHRKIGGWAFMVSARAPCYTMSLSLVFSLPPRAAK